MSARHLYCSAGRLLRLSSQRLRLSAPAASSVNTKQLQPSNLLSIRHASSSMTTYVGSGSNHKSVNMNNNNSSNIVRIQDDEDFNKRVRSPDQAAIVQFHATWCGPCKVLGPRLETAVAGQQKLLLAVVDVDELPEVSAEFRVASIPAVFATKGGKIIDSFIGLKEQEAVQDFVDAFAEKHAA